jgi:hypothetical protein
MVTAKIGFVLQPGKGCGIFARIDCGGENELEI